MCWTCRYPPRQGSRYPCPWLSRRERPCCPLPRVLPSVRPGNRFPPRRYPRYRREGYPVLPGPRPVPSCLRRSRSMPQSALSTVTWVSCLSSVVSPLPRCLPPVMPGNVSVAYLSAFLFSVSAFAATARSASACFCTSGSLDGNSRRQRSRYVLASDHCPSSRLHRPASRSERERG